MSEGDAAAFFGERAARYDSGYDRVDSDGHAARARMHGVLRMVGDGPGTVLDAGMGPGRLAAELARRGWTVSGVDAAEEMVAAARARLPEAAGRLAVAKIERLPFPDATFDAVVATGVLEYSTPPAALAELARVLRPGGRAVVSYPNGHAVYGIWKTRVYYKGVRIAKRLLRRPHPWMPRGAGVIAPTELERLLANVRLEPVAREYTSFLLVPSPLDIVLPRVAVRVGRALEGRSPSWLATQILYAAVKR